MAISLFDLYHVYSNIFQLDVKIGKVHAIPYVNNDFDRAKFVRQGDKLYSFSWCEGYDTCDPDIYLLQKLAYKELHKKLISSGYVYKGNKNKTFYKIGDEIKQSNGDIFKIYNGFVYTFPIIDDKLCFCVNHTLSLICFASIKFLIEKGLNSSQFENILVRYKTTAGKYSKGRLKELSGDYGTIKNFDSGETETISLSKIYPYVRPETISSYLRQLKVEENLTNLMRANSFLSSKTASTDRMTAILGIVDQLKEDKIFPITFGDFQITLFEEPIFVKGP